MAVNPIKSLRQKLMAGPSLVGADGEGYTPPQVNTGLAIRQWGQNQAQKNSFQSHVDWINNMGRGSFLGPSITRPSPFSQWSGFGEIMAGRGRAIEDAGGNAKIANPILSRPTKFPVQEPNNDYELENILGYTKGGESVNDRRRQSLLDYFERHYGKL